MVFDTARDMYFEDFETGLEIATAGRTVTEADIVAFAGISGDHNPLHVDAEFARDTQFGQRIAHGLLGLSIATGLAAGLGFMERTIQAFMGLEWKFRAPILIGDTIHATLQVTQTKGMGDAGGVVVFNVAVRNQRGETVQRGQWTALIKRRAQPSG